MKRISVFAMLLCLSTTIFSQESFLSICKVGTGEEIRAAFKNGGSINERDNSTGDTPLLAAAAYNQNPESISVLLELGSKNARGI